MLLLILLWDIFLIIPAPGGEGAVPFGISVYVFFTKPPFIGQTTLFWWALLALCLVNTAMTLVNIPYSALTPELTADYNEQTSLNAYRFLFAGIGTMLGAVIVMPIVTAAPSKAAGFSMAGAVIGAVIVVTTLITFFSVREAAPPVKQTEQRAESFFSVYGAVFKNRAYLVLLLIFTLHITAINFLQGMVVYYLKYIYRAEACASTVMAVLLIAVLISIPLAAQCANRFGKHVSYRIGLGVIGITAMVIFLPGTRSVPQPLPCSSAAQESVSVLPLLLRGQCCPMPLHGGKTLSIIRAAIMVYGHLRVSWGRLFLPGFPG